jgi:hypothetical protein
VIAVRALLRDRLVLVWLLLVGATAVSATVSATEGSAGRTAAAAAVLAIAFAKAWMVMFNYMEVRGAPVALRILSTAWLAVVLAILIAAYSGAFS